MKEKYYNDKNDKEDILKFNEYNKKIIAEKEQLNKKPAYINYLRETNFSGLFKKINSSPSQIENTMSTSTSKEPALAEIKGRTYDSSKMWSPVNFRGMVYEWNRGVIGINENGEVIKENLDMSGGHHADATVKVATYLGGNIVSTNRPFEAGVKASEERIVLFQSEGNGALIYFPESMTPEQIEELRKIVAPRIGFNHKGEIFEYQDVRTVVEYAISIEKEETIKLIKK